MLYKYLRVSTDKQQVAQQENTIDHWLLMHGERAGETIADQGVSGTKASWERKLGGLLEKMQQGDGIIISEMSRLTRGGIGELYYMVTNYFKPKGLRLVLCSEGLDLNCADINPITELQLSMMATFAKIERNAISERTKSALNHRRGLVEQQGGFTSKAGEWRTGFGAPKGSVSGLEGAEASARVRAAKIANDSEREKAYRTAVSLRGRGDTVGTIAGTLNALGYRTARGCEFSAGTVNRLLDNGRYYN